MKLHDERAATEFDRRLGQRLRARRLARGMSQEALAAAAGITFQQIQKYEKGVNRIAASRLFTIATALQWSMAECFSDADLGPSAGLSDDSTLIEEGLKTEEGRAVLKLMGSASSDVLRQKILRAVLGVLEDRTPST